MSVANPPWRDRKGLEEGCTPRHCIGHSKSSPTPQVEAELKQQIRNILGFNIPKYIESVGVTGINLPAARFEEIVTAILSTLKEALESALPEK